jgi:hypothetical protein
MPAYHKVHIVRIDGEPADLVRLAAEAAYVLVRRAKERIVLRLYANAEESNCTGSQGPLSSSNKGPDLGILNSMNALSYGVNTASSHADIS